MKKLLTVVLCGNSADGISDDDYGDAEIIREVGETSAFLAAAFKGAKGKYTVICENFLSFADLDGLVSAADGASADILAFEGGAAYRTSVLKGLPVKDIKDAFSACALAAISSKSIAVCDCKPLVCVKPKKFVDGGEGITVAARAFKEAKAKLAKSVYTYAFDLLCDRIVEYYMEAMLAVRSGELDADRLIGFDSELKGDIVLYLAVGKRFVAADLQKLRQKAFKISFFTAKKFSKMLYT